MKIKLLSNGGYKGFTRDMETDPIVVDAVKCDDSLGGYRVKVDDLVKAGVYDLNYGLSVSPVFGPADFNEKDGTIFFFDLEVKANIKPVLQCTQIENMPLSATLKGVQISGDSWVEITATPKTIEVHDDIITLLLHHGGFKHKTVSGEISIKRGTLVRYEVK